MTVFEQIVRPFLSQSPFPSSSAAGPRKGIPEEAVEARLEWGNGGSFGQKQDQTKASSDGAQNAETHDAERLNHPETFGFSEIKRESVPYHVPITVTEIVINAAETGTSVQTLEFDIYIPMPHTIWMDGPKRVRAGFTNASSPGTGTPETGAQDSFRQDLLAGRQIYEFSVPVPGPFTRVTSVVLIDREIPIREDHDPPDPPDPDDPNPPIVETHEFTTRDYTDRWDQPVRQSMLIIRAMQREGWGVVSSTANASGTTFEWIVSGTITFSRIILSN